MTLDVILDIVVGLAVCAALLAIFRPAIFWPEDPLDIEDDIA